MNLRATDAAGRSHRFRRSLTAAAAALTACSWSFAQTPPASAPQPAGNPQVNPAPPKPAPAAEKPPKTQAELEADFAKMLSGATLEGSFTMTGAGRDGARLSSDKYVLGDVKKLAGNVWLINARIQYGDNDYTVPLPLPIQWAGDTPVIVVDNFTIPGQGTFSARVMFFADHYSGYWKHGARGGNMFGVVKRAAADGEPAAAQAAPVAPAGERPKQ